MTFHQCGKLRLGHSLVGIDVFPILSAKKCFVKSDRYSQSNRECTKNTRMISIVPSALQLREAGEHKIPRTSPARRRLNSSDFPVVFNWKRGRDPRPHTFTLSLRKPSVLLRADVVLTKDIKWPYEGQCCGKIDRKGSCKADGGP